MPKTIRNIAVAIALGIFVAGGAPFALAQSDTAPKKTLNEKAKERRDRLEARDRARQAKVHAQEEANIRAYEARKRKRAACAREADRLGLHLLKRQRYIRDCRKR